MHQPNTLTRVRVWDLPTRIFHWMLASAVIAMLISGTLGGNAMVWHLRLGYVVAPEPVFGKMVQAKQAADLHTPSFSQRIVYEAVQDGFLDAHIPSIRTLYGQQCERMLAALEREFPKQVTWNRPDGGMFIWVDLPEGVDSGALLAKAIERNVAFVPGAPFYAVDPKKNTLRLSFVTVPGEKIDAGVKILGELHAVAVGHREGGHARVGIQLPDADRRRLREGRPRQRGQRRGAERPAGKGDARHAEASWKPCWRG